jgi:hypothetical protein
LSQSKASTGSTLKAIAGGALGELVGFEAKREAREHVSKRK